MRPLAALTPPLMVAALAAVATPAHADRGEITEASPSTLQPHEVKVGLGDVAIGLFGHELLRRFEVGTRPIAWVPSMLGAPSYDVRAKFELWRDEHLSLAVAAEHLAVDLAPLLDETDGHDVKEASFRVTPLEGWAGLRLGDRFRINAGAIYTQVALRGATATEAIDELGAAVGTSNLQVRGNVMVAVTPTINVVLGGRWVAWQKEWGEVSGSEGVGGDGAPEGEVSNTTRGEADLMGLGTSAWSASAEVHLTWDHTNLRLGLEYGNYSVPILNFVASERGFMPVVDLYWRI